MKSEISSHENRFGSWEVQNEEEGAYSYTYWSKDPPRTEVVPIGEISRR